jgi:hypothetical protein
MINIAGHHKGTKGKISIGSTFVTRPFLFRSLPSRLTKTKYELHRLEAHDFRHKHDCLYKVSDAIVAGRFGFKTQRMKVTRIAS